MDNTQATIITTLGLDPVTLRRQRRKRWWWGMLLLLLIGSGIALWRATPPAPTLNYKIAPAHQGDLVVRVTATGNLRPTNVVDVGIEVSGTVAKVAVDFNDTVKRGELLAQLDTTKLTTAVLKSRAALASAQAQVDQVQATVIETQATLNRLERMRKLTGGKLPTEQELISAQAAERRAVAEEANAKAAVIQAQATLDGNLTDLTKATIRSPINGVVLKRAVEPGQTVAASFQAPILFTLAEDLAQMALHVNIDEADVGQVTTGQKATFTVDAYPERSYPAEITQVRYAANEPADKTTATVVNYTAVLQVDNSDLSLRPGMTATANIVVNKIAPALLVPNAALRFTPPSADATPPRNRGGVGLLGALMPRFSRPSAPPSTAPGHDPKQRRVWRLQAGQPLAVPVTVGASDGSFTAITEGEITPTTELIIDVIRQEP